MKQTQLIDLAVSFLRGTGLVFLCAPVALYWFIHGDYERYRWIIRGPAPFSSFGGGPFQLFMYVSLLLIGIACFVIPTFNQ